MITLIIGPAQMIKMLIPLLLVAGIVIAIVAVIRQKNKNSETRKWENDREKHPEDNH